MSWHAGTAFDPPTGPYGEGTSAFASHQSPEPTSPLSAIDSQQKKRKRSSVNVLEVPASEDGASPSSAKARHQPGVKRACNDCRQQKVSFEHWVIN